ncbi:TPA: TRAM domain-containing protein, partial [Staphylococcus aureus]|nr:TRAM domain-containing protein [Staphylococcus aureus]
KMKDNVPLNVKKERLQRLNKKVGHYSQIAMSKYEGQTVTVLCEGSSKKDDQVLAGYTDKNKLVNFKAPKEMIGKLVEVRIDEAKQYSLNGSFVKEVEPEMVIQ